MANATIDTPDNQYGIVHPQVLVATISSGAMSATVTIPPNTETLVVTSATPPSRFVVTATGATTGIFYPALPVAGSLIGNQSATWFVDVGNALDSQVTITVTQFIPAVWYVYADAGVHLVADATKITNRQGMAYVIPSAPSTASGDHPPNELQQVSANNVASGTVVLAAPGTGQRYRVFYAQIGAVTAGAFAGIGTAVAGPFIVNCGGAGPATPMHTDAKPTGIAIATNTGLVVGTSAGNATYNLIYTQEAV